MIFDQKCTVCESVQLACQPDCRKKKGPAYSVEKLFFFFRPVGADFVFDLSSGGLRRPAK